MKNTILSIGYKIYKIKEDIMAKLFLKSPSINNPKTKRLLIVKTDAIGDYILFRNFLKEIKKSKKYKNYEISLLGNVVWKNIFENLDIKYIDKSTFLDLRATYYKGNNYRRQILKEIGEEYFDTIINPTYSRNSIIDILISKINAKNKITFLGDNTNMSYFEKPFLDRFYTKLITTKEKFEFNRNKDFFEQILRERINITNPKINIKKKQSNYFVINPGASVKFKQWAPENFAEVIDHLVEKYKAKIYIVGSKTELELDKKVKELSKYKDNIEIKNGGTLTDLLNLIAVSRGVISNETCTPHMAVALGKRVYCVTGKLGYERMHPYPNYKEAVYIYPFNLEKMEESKNWYKNTEGLNLVDASRLIEKEQF